MGIYGKFMHIDESVAIKKFYKLDDGDKGVESCLL
jgi:hypothetical protein